jgi:hypothetical protein
MPFGLDARIVVQSVAQDPGSVEDPYVREAMRRRQRRHPGASVFAAIADPKNAAYFSLNDIEDIIGPALLPNWSGGERSHGVTAALGQRLQTPREFGTDATLVSSLIERARTIAGRPQVFVSYRWREATPLVARLVRWLAEVGYGCWWDRWSMSRAVAEGVVKAPPLPSALLSGARFSVVKSASLSERMATTIVPGLSSSMIACGPQGTPVASS